MKWLKESFHAKIHHEIRRYIIDHFPPEAQRHVHPASGIYGKSFKLVFDAESVAEKIRSDYRYSPIIWIDDGGSTHDLSIRADQSVPQQKQGRILGALWRKVHAYISSLDPLPNGPCWQLAVNGGRLHVLIGQRTYPLFSAKPLSDDSFAVTCDSANLSWYDISEDVAKDWIAEAIVGNQ